MESLAIKYRPKTFEDLYGQRAIQVILRQMVHNHAVPQALLFDGPRGTGKTTSARILAASVNCESTPVPCGHCVSCKSVFDGTSLDLIEIDAASNGLVDDIRGLRTQVLYGVGGSHRVIILDEAHSMSTAAFNALLKTLEEPPPNTIFVLLTTEPGRIPDTVLSRSTPFNFTRIAVADIVARLRFIADAEHFDIDDDLLHAIAERADGGMRDAVMLLDQMARVDIRTAAAYRELTGERDYGPTLLEHITSGDIASALAVADDQLTRTGDAQAIANTLADTLRDLLVLKAGGSLAKQGDALAARIALADRLTGPALFGALHTLWDHKTKVRVGDDPRIALDLAIVMVTEPFGTTKTPPPPSGPMSLADMKDRLR